MPKFRFFGKKRRKMDKMNEKMDKILVSEEVCKGLDAFKAEFPNQMGYVTFVIHKLREMGLLSAAEWVDKHRTVYIKAVARGWESVDLNSREAESALAEQLYEINKEAQEEMEEIFSFESDDVITVDEAGLVDDLEEVLAEIAAEYEVGKKLIIETEAVAAPRKRRKKQ
jgi:hypothetical protein